MNSLEGKVAIVTGGTGGIGEGIAAQLAARGATVMISGRSADKATAVLHELRRNGATADFVAGDVRSKADMDILAEETARRYGGIDVVVANAGGNDDEARSPAVRGPFASIDLARVAGVVAENTLAKLRPVQAALPWLRTRGSGSVIFVTSEGGRVPTPGQTAVSTFAGGLIRASKVIARELVRDRIRVNCVCVTVVRDSPSWEAVFGEHSRASEHHRKQYEKILAGCPPGVAAPPISATSWPSSRPTTPPTSRVQRSARQAG